jgi:large subunit ribosomal protein L17
MANSLFTYGRIITTKEKAKYIRPFVEKLITTAKKGIIKKEIDKLAYIHYYRQVLSKLNNKEVVRKLFGEGHWRESGGIAVMIGQLYNCIL